MRPSARWNNHGGASGCTSGVGFGAVHVFGHRRCCAFPKCGLWACAQIRVVQPGTVQDGAFVHAVECLHAPTVGDALRQERPGLARSGAIVYCRVVPALRVVGYSPRWRHASRATMCRLGLAHSHDGHAGEPRSLAWLDEFQPLTTSGRRRPTSGTRWGRSRASPAWGRRPGRESPGCRRRRCASSRGDERHEPVMRLRASKATVGLDHVRPLSVERTPASRCPDTIGLSRRGTAPGNRLSG